MQWMSEWLMRKESDPKSRIDGNSIKMTAKKIQSLLEIPEPDQLTFSNGWLESFLKRKGLKMQRFHGEAASVNVDDVCSERTRVQQAIEAFANQGGSFNDVFNLDETSFFYAAIPGKGYSRSSKKSGTKQPKTRLTIALICNATRSDILVLNFICKSKKPRCFLGKTALEHGFSYFANHSAWMTSNIFETVLTSWNKSLSKKGRKIMLWVDNFSGHSQKEYSNIKTCLFSPNFTSHVQPLDSGIINSFKTRYKSKMSELTVDKLTIDANFDVDLFAWNQLNAMNLAKKLWKETFAETIRSCWRKARILPNLSNTVEETDSTMEKRVNEDLVHFREEQTSIITGLRKNFNRIMELISDTDKTSNPISFDDYLKDPEFVFEQISKKRLVELLKSREIDQESEEQDSLQSIDPIIDDTSTLKILIEIEMLFAQNNLEISIDFRKQISTLRRKKSRFN